MTASVSGQMPVATAVARPVSAGSGPDREWDRLYRGQLFEAQHREGSRAMERQASGSDRRPADRKRSHVLNTSAAIHVGGHPGLIVHESRTQTIPPALTEEPNTAIPAGGAQHVGIAPTNDVAALGMTVALLERSGAVAGYSTDIAAAAPQSDDFPSTKAELVSSARESRSSAEGTPAAWIDRVDALAVAGAASSVVAARTGAPKPTRLDPLRPAHSAGRRVLSNAATGSLIAASVAGAAAAHDRRQGAGNWRQGAADRERADSATGGFAGQHYGTVPLIVSDQLLELEFVALGRDERSVEPRAVQQVRVSFQAPGSGRIGLSAHHHGNKVTVELEDGEATDPVKAGSGFDIRALLVRLGWGSLPVEITRDAAIQNGNGATP